MPVILTVGPYKFFPDYASSSAKFLSIATLFFPKACKTWIPACAGMTCGVYYPLGRSKRHPRAGGDPDGKTLTLAIAVVERKTIKHSAYKSAENDA